MKVTSAYYLLLIYSIAMCKPMVPVIEDIAAHAFWRVEHIAVVHAHQGKNHVHNEIKEAAKQGENSNTDQTSKNFEQVSLHIIQKTNYNFTWVFKIAKNFPLQLYLLQSPYLEINGPPPKV